MKTAAFDTLLVNGTGYGEFRVEIGRGNRTPDGSETALVIPFSPVKQLADAPLILTAMARSVDWVDVDLTAAYQVSEVGIFVTPTGGSEILADYFSIGSGYLPGFVKLLQQILIFRLRTTFTESDLTNATITVGASPPGTKLTSGLWRGASTAEARNRLIANRIITPDVLFDVLVLTNRGLSQVAGLTPAQIGQAYVAAFSGITASQVATALQAAGFTASQVATALQAAFSGITASQVATALQAAFSGITASQVATALQAAGFTASQVATALQAAGFTASQVATALQAAFSGITASQVATALQAAGFTASQVATALQAAFSGITASQVATALQAAGFTASQVATALQAAFSGITASQVATALQAAFSGITASQVATALQAAGFGYSVDPQVNIEDTPTTTSGLGATGATMVGLLIYSSQNGSTSTWVTGTLGQAVTLPSYGQTGAIIIPTISGGEVTVPDEGAGAGSGSWWLDWIVAW